MEKIIKKEYKYKNEFIGCFKKLTTSPYNTSVDDYFINELKRTKIVKKYWDKSELEIAKENNKDALELNLQFQKIYKDFLEVCNSPKKILIEKNNKNLKIICLGCNKYDNIIKKNYYTTSKKDEVFCKKCFFIKIENDFLLSLTKLTTNKETEEKIKMPISVKRKLNNLKLMNHQKVSGNLFFKIWYNIYWHLFIKTPERVEKEIKWCNSLFTNYNEINKKNVK